MHRPTPAALLLAGLLLALTACGSDGASSRSGSGGADTGGPVADAGATTTLDLGGACKGHGECKSGYCSQGVCAEPDTHLADGAACEADGLCESGVCFGGACARTCLRTEDCSATDTCVSDDGARLFCHTPTFAAELGKSCAGTGKCSAGLVCSNAAEAVDAVCTAACSSDVDCPTTLACRDRGDGQAFCLPRHFCDQCQHDAQCGPGKVCVDMGNGGARFCSKKCTIGGTECPRYARCTDVGGGLAACTHPAGTCKAAKPGLCSPCNGPGSCQPDGMCLRWPTTMEFFCGRSCTDDASCGSGYKCYTVNKAGTRQCVPAIRKQVAYPGKKVQNNVTQFATCQDTIRNYYEVGDIIDDYAMVGVVDTNGDDSVLDEQPRIVRLSDFEAHEVIFFTVAAGWCSACQKETLDFRNLYKQYGGELVIFQALFEGFVQGKSRPTFNVLKQWNAKLKPIGGAVGVDYTGRIRPANILGSTPLNMLLDAKTRRILAKWNGYSHYTFVSQLNKIMSQYKK